MLTPATPVEMANSALRDQLRSLLSSPTDVIITHIEVNEKHGVGTLTLTLFGGNPAVISVRSQDHFGGRQEFGRQNFRLSHQGSRPTAYMNVLAAFQGMRLRRVLCVPYYSDDVLTAIALKDIHSLPLCTYLMDDQNVFSNGIPDYLMRELLAKSDLRLAISPQLRAAYEQKFGLRFWLLPPAVVGKLIQSEPRIPTATALRTRRGVMVGNVWGRRWLDLLRATVRDSGIQLDWYCNSDHSHGVAPDELAADGIHAHGRVGDEALIDVLRERPFALVPSGTLDGSDDRAYIAQLSLPSRITYILATSNTPIVVLGNERTAAAQFVTRSGIGVVAPYDPAALRRAAESVMDPAAQWEFRQTAAGMAPGFSADGVSEWIWQSLDAGAAVDDRFEKLIPETPSR